jgi:hypothetical protein
MQYFITTAFKHEEAQNCQSRKLPVSSKAGRFIYKHFMSEFYIGNKCNDKAIPTKAWTGPEGSRRSRLPQFLQSAHEGGKVVSPTHRPPLPHR